MGAVMKGISINLLPEIEVSVRKQTQKNQLIKTISISTLLLLFFLSSLILTLRVLQTRTITRIQSEAFASEQQIEGLKDKESILVLLKDRLDQIEKISGVPSKQREMYEQVVNKLPASISYSAIAIDAGGNLSLAVVAPSQAELTNLFKVLESEETFEKVANISVESLSRGKDNSYRASLEISSK
jgi:Tfp pilus assembly protein PilN